MIGLKNLNLTAALEIPEIKPHHPFPEIPWLTSTLLTCFLMTAIVLVFCLIVRFICIPRWEKRKSPGMLQTVLESVIGMFEKEGHESVGHNSKFLAPWYLGVCCFILVGVLMELLGFRAPISDLNITLALGISTFLMIWIFGVKEKKWARFNRYLLRVGKKTWKRKIPVFVNPINILTDSVIPFSMALRLFGSVFSGYIIMHLLYSFGWFAVGPLGLIGTIIATLFHAFIQSYVFMMLSYAFIGEATE